MSHVLHTGSPRGPYPKGVRRRAQIVETALKVFAELGYVGGSIRTIAEQVGASPGSLIQYFGSKEGLLMAVLDEWSRQTSATHSGDGLAGLSYFESLRDDLMPFHLQHRGLLELFLTMAAEASSSSHPARAFIQRHYADNFRAWALHLQEATDRKEIEPLREAAIESEVRTLTAVADGLELQWLLNPAIDLAGLFNTYLDLTIARWKSGMNTGESVR